MPKFFYVAVMSIALAAACAITQPGHELRIDASSPEAAEASYNAMMRVRSHVEKQELAIAVLMINMEGVESAHEVARNPELQSTSVARIRHKIAGMSAEEIIERAERNPSVRVEVSRQ